MVDYSKWNSLARELDGEEEEATTPLHEEPSEAPSGLSRQFGISPLLARFVLVQQAEYGRTDNVDRYQQVLKLVAEHPEIMEQHQTLVDAALKAVNEGIEGYGELASAANTLLAMKKHGPVELFATIATPSDEKAKALRIKYARREFVKEAFLEKTLGVDEYRKMRELVQQAEEDVEFCPKWCPCPAIVSKCVIC